MIPAEWDSLIRKHLLPRLRSSFKGYRWTASYVGKNMFNVSGILKGTFNTGVYTLFRTTIPKGAGKGYGVALFEQVWMALYFQVKGES